MHTKYYVQIPWPNCVTSSNYAGSRWRCVAPMEKLHMTIVSPYTVRERESKSQKWVSEWTMALLFERNIDRFSCQCPTKSVRALFLYSSTGLVVAMSRIGQLLAIKLPVCSATRRYSGTCWKWHFIIFDRDSIWAMDSTRITTTRTEKKRRDVGYNYIHLFKPACSDAWFFIQQQPIDNVTAITFQQLRQWRGQFESSVTAFLLLLLFYYQKKKNVTSGSLNLKISGRQSHIHMCRGCNAKVAGCVICIGIYWFLVPVHIRAEVFTAVRLFPAEYLIHCTLKFG